MSDNAQLTTTQQVINDPFAQMDNNPKFAALSYADQQATRIALVQNLLARNSNFQQLSPQDQQATFRGAVEKVTARPPAFTDPKLRDQVTQMAIGYMNGDPEQTDKFKYALSQADFERTGLIAQVANKLINAALPASIPRMPGFAIGISSPETDKAFAYMKQVAYTKDKGGTQALQTLDSITNGLLDFLPFTGVGKMAATAGKIAAAALTKNVASAGATSFVKAVLPELFTATPFAPIGTVIENAKAYLTNSPEGYTDTLGKVVSSLGINAATGLLFGTAARGLMYGAKTTASAVFRVKKGPGYVSPTLAEEQRQALLKMTAEGGPTNPETFATLPPEAQDLRYMTNRVKTIAAGPLDDLHFRQADQAYLNAYEIPQLIVRQLDDGSWRVHEAVKGKKGRIDYRQSTFVNTLDFNKYLSGKIVDNLQTLSPEAQKLYLDKFANPDIAVPAITGRQTEALYNPARDPSLTNVEANALNRAYGKSYVPANHRLVISTAELNKVAEAAMTAGADSRVFRVQADPQSPLGQKLQKMPKLQRLAGDSSMTFSGDTADGNVALIMRSPASAADYAAAQSDALQAASRNSLDSVDNLRTLYLTRRGFDGYVHPDGTLETFYPENLKIISERVNPATGKYGQPTQTKISSALANRAIITREVKETLGPEYLKNQENLVGAATKLTSSQKPAEVTNFVRNYLLASGRKPGNLRTVVTTDAKAISEGRVTIDGKSGRIIVPAKIETPEQQLSFVRNLLEETRKYSKSVEGNARPVSIPSPNKIAELTKHNVSHFTAPLGTQAQETWISNIVNNELHGSVRKLPDGTYGITLPGMQTPRVLNSLDDLTTFVANSTVDASILKQDLASQGFRLTERDGTYHVIGRGVNIEANNIPDILNKLNYNPPRLDVRYGPKIAEINDGSITTFMDSEVVGGNRQKVMQFLSNFEDKQAVAAQRRIILAKDGAVTEQPTGKFRVTLSKYGIDHEFDSLTDAKKFLTGNWKNIDSLAKLADERGFALRYEGGKFSLYDLSGDMVEAPTLDKLMEALKTYPVPRDGAPSVLPADLENSLDPIIRDLRAKGKLRGMPAGRRPTDPYLPDIDMPPEQRPLQGTTTAGVSRWWRQAASWVETETRKMGDYGKKVMDAFTDMRIQEQNMRAEKELIDRLIYDAFTVDGKLIPKVRRQAIYHWGGAQSFDEFENARSVFGELTASEQNVLKKVRDIYDALGKKFGVDPSIMKTNYMPRMMRRDLQALHNKMRSSNPDVMSEDLFNEFFKGNTPKSFDVFFKHDRVNETLKFLAEDDAIKVAMGYNSLGHKDMFLREPAKRLINIVNSGDPSVTPTMQTFITKYIERTFGRVDRSNEEALKSVVRNIFMKLPGKMRRTDVQAARIADSFLQTVYSLNYLTNLGFRAWSSVKNAFQLWTNIAPKIGFRYIMDALSDIHDNLGESYFRHLRTIGVLGNSRPLAQEIINAESRLGRLTNKALKGFENVDDYMRTIAYRASELRFQEAYAKFKSGVFKGDTALQKFSQYAGINLTGDSMERRILGMLRTGGADEVTGAKHLFANWMQMDTMFDYHQNNAPLIHQGFLGRLFGMYGNFSAGYRTSLMRGLQNGTAGQKAAFLTRFIAGHVAVAGALGALGIRNDNFLPFVPMVSSGGPYWRFAIDLLESTQPGKGGAQARAKTLRDVAGFIPGAMEVHYLSKAAAYLDKGDMYRALMSLMTVSMMPPK